MKYLVKIKANRRHQNPCPNFWPSPRPRPRLNTIFCAFASFSPEWDSVTLLKISIVKQMRVSTSELIVPDSSVNFLEFFQEESSSSSSKVSVTSNVPGLHIIDTVPNLNFPK